MKPINLKDLARELNLSIATVSRAMQDSYEVAEATKARVQALAAAWHYEPNAYASSLRRNISKTIGVVIPQVANNFFSLAINGIEEVARQSGYHVLIYLTHDDPAREKAIVQHLGGGRVDGLLMSVGSESQDFTHLEKLQQKGVSLVFFDRVCEAIATAKVTTDDYESGYRATQHLLAAGCRRIAYLLVSGNLSIGRRRMDGYCAALQDHGLPHDADLVLEADTDHAHTGALLRTLLERRPDIDGIFASVERLVINAYQECRVLGLRVPADVKIIGFSNLEIAALLDPPLTTITQPAYEIGREAAKILLRAIEKRKPISPSQSRVLQSTLVARRSTLGS